MIAFYKVYVDTHDDTEGNAVHWVFANRGDTCEPRNTKAKTTAQNTNNIIEQKPRENQSVNSSDEGEIKKTRSSQRQRR